MSSKRLEDKVAIVTGAGSGIGQAVAMLFVEQGARVVLIDSSQRKLEHTLEKIKSDQASFCVADVSDQVQIEACIEATIRGHGRIDIAVLNAGVAGINCPIEEYPVEMFDEVMGVNLRAVWLGLRGVIPIMKENKRGSIIMTSSIQGLSALPGTTAYTTSKHGLVGMMKGAALELAELGIRVNTVHPGYVATPMMNSIHEEVLPSNPDKFQAAIAQSIPMQRYASAREVAQLVLFLGSDESSYSTGGSFTADGGILASLPAISF